MNQLTLKNQLDKIFLTTHYFIYTYQICRFCICRMWHVHIREMQNLQITFAYIK